ncbi:7537_t:CDS:2, partial [Scutellospora calospora]
YDSEIGETSKSEDLEYINKSEDIVRSKLTYKEDSDESNKDKDMEEYFKQKKKFEELLEELTIKSSR